MHIFYCFKVEILCLSTGDACEKFMFCGTRRRVGCTMNILFMLIHYKICLYIC